jgi:hypothetical protein
MDLSRFFHVCEPFSPTTETDRSHLATEPNERYLSFMTRAKAFYHQCPPQSIHSQGSTEAENIS